MYMNKKIIIVLISALFVLGAFYYWNTFLSKNITEKTNKVTFVCDAGKTIGATFYMDNDRAVDLVLSDGRSLSVPHALSASGARYANADETFVFWNKGNTAFITEGKSGALTFVNCVIR